MAIYVALFAAAGAMAWLIKRYDLYDREPWFVSTPVMVAGAAAMAALGPAEDAAIQLIGRGQPSIPHIALVAASFEESARLLIVLGVAVVAPRYFNDPMDGLIYGSLVGLGMALEEAIHWTAIGGGTFASVLPVEIVRLFGHVLMGGITGFGVGLMHRHGGGRAWIPVSIGCLLAGTSLHYAWDYVALASALSVDASWAVVASMGLMLAALAGYGLLIVIGSAWSRQRFAPGSSARVWRRS
jgi:RsiW-degrading membrane proteinase PrsW (M82 family)